MFTILRSKILLIWTYVYSIFGPKATFKKKGLEGCKLAWEENVSSDDLFDLDSLRSINNLSAM